MSLRMYFTPVQFIYLFVCLTTFRYNLKKWLTGEGLLFSPKWILVCGYDITVPASIHAWWSSHNSFSAGKKKSSCGLVYTISAVYLWLCLFVCPDDFAGGKGDRKGIPSCDKWRTTKLTFIYHLIYHTLVYKRRDKTRGKEWPLRRGLLYIVLCKRPRDARI